MAFPLVSSFFRGVEYARPSLNPLYYFSEKMFCFLILLCSCLLKCILLLCMTYVISISNMKADACPTYVIVGLSQQLS